jgi:hypothetical protein
MRSLEDEPACKTRVAPQADFKCPVTRAGTSPPDFARRRPWHSEFPGELLSVNINSFILQGFSVETTRVEPVQFPLWIPFRQFLDNLESPTEGSNELSNGDPIGFAELA